MLELMDDRENRGYAPVEIPNALPPVLTVKEVAAYLRVGKSTAYEIMKRRDFPAIRVGHVVRVTRENFLAWVEGQKNKA